MISIQKSFTPVAANLNGYATGVTGATWTITTASSSDSLAHQVTIKNNTATDHSAKTAIITGTDADGNVQSETVNLPAGSATVTSAQYYLTVTSVVPSATIGADTMGIGWSQVSVSHTLILDSHQIPAAFASIVITGTVNISMQETGSNPWVTPSLSAVWVAPTAFASKTASLTGVFDVSVQAVRLLVNSVTAGATVAIAISQSGVLG